MLQKKGVRGTYAEDHRTVENILGDVIPWCLNTVRAEHSLVYSQCFVLSC